MSDQVAIFNEMKIKNLINYKTDYRKNRVYRVRVTNQNVQGVGSGFFVSKNKFITCFHVVFGKELKHFKSDQTFNALQGENEHSKLENFFNSTKPKIEIGTEDGKWMNGTLINFSEKYDLAVLEVEVRNCKVNVCSIEWNYIPQYGDKVLYGGFPSDSEYQIDNSPFALYEGLVSSFPEKTVGGEKYEHIQINSINLGGNSGAPLFLRNGKKIVGLINGVMNWGNDNVYMHNYQTNLAAPASFRIPVGVAYATNIKFLKEFI